MRKSTKRIIAVAYHEAGHAAMALHLGIRLARRGATIVPTKEYLGLVRFRLSVGSQHLDRPWKLSDRVRLRLERHIMVSMAGEAVQRFFAPGSVRNGHFDQDQSAANFIANHITRSPEEKKALLALLKIRVQDIVCELPFQSKVVAVAQALLTQQTLSASELQTIVDDAAW